MVRTDGWGEKKTGPLGERGPAALQKVLWSAHALVHLARTRRSVSLVREPHMLMRQIRLSAKVFICWLRAEYEEYLSVVGGRVKLLLSKRHSCQTDNYAAACYPLVASRCSLRRRDSPSWRSCNMRWRAGLSHRLERLALRRPAGSGQQRSCHVVNNVLPTAAATGPTARIKSENISIVKD